MKESNMSTEHREIRHLCLQVLAGRIQRRPPERAIIFMPKERGGIKEAHTPEYGVPYISQGKIIKTGRDKEQRR